MLRLERAHLTGRRNFSCCRGEGRWLAADAAACCSSFLLPACLPACLLAFEGLDDEEGRLAAALPLLLLLLPPPLLLLVCPGCECGVRVCQCPPTALRPLPACFAWILACVLCCCLLMPQHIIQRSFNRAKPRRPRQAAASQPNQPASPAAAAIAKPGVWRMLQPARGKA